MTLKEKPEKNQSQMKNLQLMALLVLEYKETDDGGFM
jgi:hypothetical protein